MNNISPQYLAGVMDSDGSFSITRRHLKRPSANYTCMVQLTWTKSDLSIAFMDSLVSMFGGSYFTGFPSGKKSYPNTKETVKYCATGVAAEKITVFVLPFLILKKEQASNILKTRDLVRSFSGSRPLDVTFQLEVLYQQNRSINRKNEKYATFKV